MPEQSGSVGFVGFGVGRKGSLWVAHKGRQTPTTHICFRALTRAAVGDFHAAALDAGARDNGVTVVGKRGHDQASSRELMMALVHQPAVLRSRLEMTPWASEAERCLVDHLVNAAG